MVTTGAFIIITNSMDIVTYLKECVCRSEDGEQDVEEGQTSHSRHDNENIIISQRSNASKLSLPKAGYIQMVFQIILYFQVASMLRVKYQGKQTSNLTDGIRQTIDTIFNFRFIIYQGVCPSDTLELPEKEAILFGMKLLTFVMLIILIVAYTLVRYFSLKIRSAFNVTSGLRGVTTHLMIPLNIISREEDNGGESIIEPQRFLKMKKSELILFKDCI